MTKAGKPRAEITEEDLHGIIRERVLIEIRRYAMEYGQQLLIAGFSAAEIGPLINQYVEKITERCPAIEATVLRRLMGGTVLH